MSGGLAKGFLDDIVANIDDDTPRLVYADWLVENGQEERAELIRVQVERARLPAWATAHACRAVAPVEAVTVRWPRKGEGKAGTPIAELRELSLTGWPDSEDEV